jgi:hypothetical protein
VYQPCSHSSKKGNWGDEEDDLPESTESAPDSNGVITITEYKFNEKNEKVKVIKRVKKYTYTKKVYKAVEERRVSGGLLYLTQRSHHCSNERLLSIFT